MTASAERWRALALLSCLLLPWLNSRAGGPSASVEPWLLSALCGAAAYGLLHPRAPHGAIRIVLAGIACWTFARSGLTPDTLGVAAACLLVFMAASIAAEGRRQPELIRIFALAWLLAAAVSTAIALAQYFGLVDHQWPWISVTGAGEAFANLRQRNQFATLTVIGMATLFWLAPRHLSRWQAMTAMAWLAIGNAATTSRTGLAGMIGLGVLACLWCAAGTAGNQLPPMRVSERWERVLLWLGGLAAYALAAATLPWLLERATDVTAHRLWERVASVDSCSSRAVLWSNVAHLIVQKPWLGWGWGELDYAHYATLYEGLRFCDILDNAHNLPLHLAVELGLPAALIFCSALTWAVLRARPWAESDPLRQMAWAALAVMALHSLLEYPLWYGPFQLAVGLCLGLLAPGRQRETPAGSGAAVCASSLAAVSIAACAYAAWDYQRVSQIYLSQEDRHPAWRQDTLEKAGASFLFANQARFAELTTVPLSHANAPLMHGLAVRMLHYSPEPRVIEKAVETAVMLDRPDEALLDLARYRAAFPQAYQEWRRGQGLAPVQEPASTPARIRD